MYFLADVPSCHPCASFLEASLRSSMTPEIRKLRVCNPHIFIFMYCSYDKEAPTSVGAKQIPSFVLILCAVFVTGSTQAASLVSRVVRP
jgi:hypothetical protein